MRILPINADNNRTNLSYPFYPYAIKGFCSSVYLLSIMFEFVKVEQAHFTLYPLPFILYPLSFILYPLSFIHLTSK